MDKKKIAVIGDPSSVMIFKAVGFDVFYEEEQEQIERRIHHLADEGYAVIYITEALAAELEHELDHFRLQPLPAIIPIPGVTGNTGMGIKMVKKSGPWPSTS